jgi:hypothetical protein
MLRRLGWHYIRIHAFELFADPDAVATRIAALIGVNPLEETDITGPIEIPRVVAAVAEPVTAPDVSEEVVQTEARQDPDAEIASIDIVETVLVEQVGDTLFIEDEIVETITYDAPPTAASFSEPDAVTEPLNLPSNLPTTQPEN